MLQSLPVGMMVSTDGILFAQDLATMEWTLDGVVSSCLVNLLEQSLMSLNDNSTGTEERRDPKESWVIPQMALTIAVK